MKTLDVQALHHAIDQTLEQLKQQSDEFAKVKKAVDGITSLDDALKGKGGDAIRAFYEECHTPFLQFYDTFIEEYSSTLKKMKSALNSLEPNHNGFISQSFLEHELENGLNAADRTTKNLVSKTNATIAKVSHIVDLPDLNDSGFHEQNQKALKEISTTLEKLHAFDREQTNALKTAENDLETMQKYIGRLEKMYTGPKIEITGYQKGAILKQDDNSKINGLPGGLQGQLENAEPSPMEMMLEKLNKNKQSNVDTVIREDNEENINQDVHTNDFDLNALQKELAKHPKVYGDIRVIDGKLYNHKGWKVVKDIHIPDEAVRDHSDPSFIGGRYRVYENGQIVRTYIANDKEEVMVVDRIPEARGAASAKINDSYFEGTPLEILEYLNLGNATRTLGKKAITKVEKAAEKALKNEVKDVKKVIAERSKSLDLKEHPTKTKQFGSKKMKELKKKIDNRTITKQEYQDYIWNKKFAKKRKAGVTEFWDMEAERIMNGQPTTRNWSEKQVQDILSGKVPKYDGKPMAGHHTYSASKYPHLSDKGEIIYPATFKEHFYGWHGGNWKNSKPGEPIKSIKDF
ncbi:T7SS effector LXG polymorphic toxin [Bacillus licheniformis]|uniref:T7SS effector LXG polymorphic toxin n=2 Tax=Bacillus licheniformis TaxID=1402 RepID=UPI0009C313F9|nr:T7SS effector LXG polymorphic toxin [Bacillus licheniformis]ARC72092.1 ribonuclease YxiD [Bacillus licheniformis]ARW52700.1 Ribonuclease YxiD [Bacillus licheniformis]